MCFSDYEGKRKGIRLAGHGASEAVKVADDTHFKTNLFFRDSILFRSVFWTVRHLSSISDILWKSLHSCHLPQF